MKVIKVKEVNTFYNGSDRGCDVNEFYVTNRELIDKYHKDGYAIVEMYEVEIFTE